MKPNNYKHGDAVEVLYRSVPSSWKEIIGIYDRKGSIPFRHRVYLGDTNSRRFITISSRRLRNYENV
jgi:hypothetical protein